MIGSPSYWVSVCPVYQNTYAIQSMLKVTVDNALHLHDILLHGHN